MSIKNLYLVASMSVMGLAFTACSHDDYIDENAGFNNLKVEYKANFEAKYGKISPNQSWDFSTNVTYTSLVSNGNAARTRTNGGTFACTVGEIEVEKEALDWVHDYLPKGKNNTKKGGPFFMDVPGNPFTVVPIYQGNATYYWQLWMHVGGPESGLDKLIWSKGDDFYFKATEESVDWTELGTGRDGLGNGGFFAVKAPSYTFTDLIEGDEMYFYLKVWKNASGYPLGYDAYLAYLENQNKNKPVIYSSLQGKMISLTDAYRPSNVPSDHKVTVIGCEDGSDNDYEDLVFMVYGKPVPPTERVTEKIEYDSKRYLMEDLGTTDDFDFNDVVVDVQFNRIKYTYTWDVTTDQIIDTKTEKLDDQAIVRATGGTLDFTLTIGNTTWTKSDYKTTTEMWNTGWGGAAINPSAILGEPFKVSGFNATQNNVSVTVKGNDNGDSGKVKTITFPKEGEAPMIVAVDVTTSWMNERVSVPDTWWYLPEPKD